MEEVNRMIKDMIEMNYDALEDLNPNSEEAKALVRSTVDLYKVLSEYEIQQQRINLESDQKAKDDKIEKHNGWIKIGDIVIRAGLTIVTSLFNAAIFRNLTIMEKDTTVGSTSLKTFLKGGFNIFKPNQM